MYHGSPADRAELRRVNMDMSLLDEEYHRDVQEQKGQAKAESEDEEPTPKKRGGRGRGRGRGAKRRAPSRKAKKPAPKAEDDEPPKGSTSGEALQESEEEIHERALKNKFPVVVTTYEMVMKDRVHLSQYQWGFIVVDEGHRLKNMDCKLMREIKQYESAGRMVLTGTPLQVCFTAHKFIVRL